MQSQGHDIRATVSLDKRSSKHPEIVHGTHDASDRRRPGFPCPPYRHSTYPSLTRQASGLPFSGERIQGKRGTQGR